VLELAVQMRVTTSKRFLKFADDTYLVIPAVSCRSCVDEISHIKTWTTSNNLKLNRGTRGSGDGSSPTGPRGGAPMGVWARSPQSWRHILKITITNIVSRSHCNNTDLAILAEWITIVSIQYQSLQCSSPFLHATATDNGGGRHL